MLMLVMLMVMLVVAWGAEIRPFKVAVSEDALLDLKRRLELDLARLEDPFPAVGAEDFSRGFNYHAVKGLVSYWKDQFDWRKQEQYINTVLPQFTTEIDEYSVHFVHIRSGECQTATDHRSV